MTARLAIPDAAERDGLAVFVARVIQVDGAAVVRIRAAGERVEAFAPAPFDVTATDAVTGSVDPADVTVTGSDLLAALAVVGGPSVDPGTVVDERWRGPVPAAGPWSVVGTVPAADVDAVATRGMAAVHDAGHASAAVLDEVVFTVGDDAVRVPMRDVLALTGLGLADGDVTVSTGGGWLRLATPGGAVVRRRRAQLPLAVGR